MAGGGGERGKGQMLYRKSSLIHAPAFSYGFERRGEGAGCVMYEQTQALHRPIPPSPPPTPQQLAEPVNGHVYSTRSWATALKWV